MQNNNYFASGLASETNPGASSTTRVASETATAAPDLNPEQLLQFVVDHINEVLGRNYSLVEFDALRGRNFLQVVNDVFANLQPSLHIDLEFAPFESSIQTMLDFLLKTLGYRVPPMIQDSFQQSFADAEPTVIYPMLYWVLTHMDMNRKRIYLSRFLQPLDVPEDIRAGDEDVRMLYAQYQQLRTSFVQIHRRVDALRSAFADPQETRRKVAALEEERDHLLDNIKVAKKKLSNVPEKDAYLAESKAFRVAQEESARLVEKQLELQQFRYSADVRLSEIGSRLEALRRDAADGRVDLLIRRLRDECQSNKIKLEEQLPLELDAKMKENAELQKLLSEPLDMAVLTSENQKLDETLYKLHEKLKARLGPGADGSSIATIKQQVQRVSSRKAEVLHELGDLQAENIKILNLIREREAKLQELRSATKMLSEEEFREFSGQVRAKKAATEGMRQRLEELHTEWGILTFTRETLQSEYKEIQTAVGDLESKMGLQGYGRTVEALMKLTQEKDAMEGLKGKTLEELSRVVQDFNCAIREGRSRLAPLINELRIVRQNVAEVDEEWAEKKGSYERLEGLLTEDMRHLDEQVTRIKSSVTLNESLYHRLQCQEILQEAQIKRAQDEKKFNDNPSASLDPHYKTYMDLFMDTIRNLEERSRNMQIKRREVEENYDASVQQMEWFKSLKKILEVKLKLLQAEMKDKVANSENLDAAIQEVMGSRKGAGVDMLVLHNN